MFKQMTIGKKIALGFTVILLLTAVLAVIGITQIKDVKTDVEDISGVHIPLMGAVTSIDAAATNQHSQVSLYALHKEEAQLEKFNAGDEEVDQALEQARSIINSDDELVELGWLDKVEKIEQVHDVFVTNCRKFIEVIQDESSTSEQIQHAADVQGPVVDRLEPKPDEGGSQLEHGDQESQERERLPCSSESTRLMKISSSVAVREASSIRIPF